MTRLLTILTLIFGVFLASCSSGKNATTTDAQTAQSQAVQVVQSTQEAQSQQQIVNSTNSRSADVCAEWNDIYVPVKVNVTKPMSMSLSGRATMVRGEVINISMRVLGMEVAVLNIDQETITFLDKYHKYMFSESLAKVLGSHKMTVADIQDLILYHTDTTLTLAFNNPGSSTPVTVSFEKPIATDYGTIASNITISADVNNIELKAGLQWSLDSAKWNTGRTVSFTIPTSGYKIITLENAKSIFENLGQ